MASKTDPGEPTEKDGNLSEVPPEIRHVREPRWSVLVNGFFFLLAGVAAVWALVAIFFSSHDHNWTLIFFVIALWAVVAYWLLPRIHKVLSAMYVPNYFIGRSRTSDGIMGDPINVAFDGSADHIHRMMQACLLYTSPSPRD